MAEEPEESTVIPGEEPLVPFDEQRRLKRDTVILDHRPRISYLTMKDNTRWVLLVRKVRTPPSFRVHEGNYILTYI